VSYNAVTDGYSADRSDVFDHAHDDLLEVWLETGVVGLILIGMFLLWLVRRTYQVWRLPRSDDLRPIDRSLARAAAVILVLLLAHSLVDYPLRTSAMVAIAAFATSLLIPPIGVASAESMGLEKAAHRMRRAADFRATEPVMLREPGSLPTVSEPIDQIAVPRPSTSRASERWGQAIEWPDAWRESKTPPKPTDGSDKKKG
jgi:hypothetical protein